MGKAMIDVLNKHFQNALGILEADSCYVQSVWYAAYFLMALPSGWISERYGLMVVIVGCLLFVPVTKITWSSSSLFFDAFLAALFLVGSGLAILEKVANPYTTVLGSTSSAVTRINLAQSCNGVGWIIGPVIASNTRSDD